MLDVVRFLAGMADQCVQARQADGIASVGNTQSVVQALKPAIDRDRQRMQSSRNLFAAMPVGLVLQQKQIVIRQMGTNAQLSPHAAMAPVVKFHRQAAQQWSD